MTESRPKSKRSISFAKAGWKQPSSQLSVPAPARLSNLHPNRRPAAGRSVSFAHARRPSTPRRPGFAPRSLSFCDTRWTPSGQNLSLREGSVSGPFAFLNPTTAIFDIWTDDGNELADVTSPERGQKARVRWNARDFRKGILLCNYISREWFRRLTISQAATSSSSPAPHRLPRASETFPNLGESCWASGACSPCIRTGMSPGL